MHHHPKENAADSSVRHVLEHFYPLDGHMPRELVERVSPMKPAFVHTNSSHSREDQAIANIFKDTRITFEEREQISAAILHGNFELVSGSPPEKHHAKPRIIPKDVEKLRIAELTVSRHKLPKPSFLQVVTQAAPIPVMSGKEARAQKLRVQLRQSSPSHSPEVPHGKHAHHSPASGKQHSEPVYFDSVKQLSLKEAQNQLVAEHNRKRRERAKEEARLKSEQATQLRTLEQATAEKKMEVKKKLQDVRKSLRNHLVNNRDPQVGTIMRLVDESLIYHFMEKYAGFSMSAQAILSLIGNSLGTNLMDAEIPTDDTPLVTAATHTRNVTAESVDSQDPRGRVGTRVSSQLLTNSRQMSAVDFDDSRHNTPGTERHENSTSRGRSRALLDSAPAPGSIARSARQCARITNDREFQSTELRTHSQERLLSDKSRTGMNDVVSGITPRRYKADRPVSPDSKAWGGGFRVVLPKTDASPMKPIVPMSITRPASLPARPRSSSPTQSRSRKPPKSAGNADGGLAEMSKSQSLVVFGSENVRRAARALGFTSAGAEEEFTDDLISERIDRDDENEHENEHEHDNQSIHSHHSHHSVGTLDSYHTSVPANAIAAMQEQLIEENNLPSMQPEIVLSEQQIEELGLHKKTFTQIMKDISKTSSFRTDATRSTELGLTTEQPLLSQYSAPQSPQLSNMPSAMENRSEISLRGDSHTDSLKSSNLNSIVSGMMSSTIQVRTLFVEPLSATAAVPPAPKTFSTLFGSVYTEADKERFQNLSALEVERGEERHGIPRAQVSPHHIGFSRPYEGSPGKTLKLAPLPGSQANLAPLAHAPIAIKTKPGKRDANNNPIPESPYKSYEEECKVQNTGVPAGAGYMLWRPRYRVSKDGRYRAGQNHTRIRASIQEGPVKRPFISSA